VSSAGVLAIHRECAALRAVVPPLERGPVVARQRVVEQRIGEIGEPAPILLVECHPARRGGDLGLAVLGEIAEERHVRAEHHGAEIVGRQP